MFTTRAGIVCGADALNEHGVLSAANCDRLAKQPKDYRSKFPICQASRQLRFCGKQRFSASIWVTPIQGYNPAQPN